MSQATENRVMLLTPPGAGAIAVVRVFGPGALAMVCEFLDVPLPEGSSSTELASKPDVGAASCAVQRHCKSEAPSGDGGHSTCGAGGLRVGRFIVDGEVVDEVVISRVNRGGSAAVDIASHGGVRVVERILDALSRKGASLCTMVESFPPVWPAGNRIEEEADLNLASAKTERAVRFLAWQRAHLAETLEHAAQCATEHPCGTQAVLEAVLDGFEIARMLIKGVTVAIIGPPNTGKSSLFNALVGRSATIVSPVPGTTRDWVDASVEIGGLPVRLVDTAGRQEDASPIEVVAIAGGRSISKEADACMLVLDGSRPPTAESPDPDFRPSDQGPRSRILVLLNKADLGSNRYGFSAIRLGLPEGTPWMEISALTGVGLDRLPGALLGLLRFSRETDPSATLFTIRQADVTRSILSDLATRPEAAALRIRHELIGKHCAL